MVAKLGNRAKGNYKTIGGIGSECRAFFLSYILKFNFADLSCGMGKGTSHTFTRFIRSCCFFIWLPLFRKVKELDNFQNWVEGDMVQYATLGHAQSLCTLSRVTRAPGDMSKVRFQYNQVCSLVTDTETL